MTPNTDALDFDAPSSADDDSAYPYLLIYHKNIKTNMTSNTDDPDNDSPGAANDDDVSPESIILDSSLKLKIYHQSML